MGKYDWITKEQLEDLYIKQNLSKCEVCKILNMSKTSFARKAKEFNICKPMELSVKCLENTFMKKYGVTNPNKSADTLLKRKKTNLQRYGNTCALQSIKVKAKAEQTNLEKYGAKNVFQSESIKNKIAKTNIERYGSKVSLQNPQVKSKAKATCLARYGVENVFASREIKTKIKETNLKKYGVENPSQNKEIQNKKFETMKENKSFNKSTEEDKIYSSLSKIYSNVLRQYSSEEYPFACDFYIPEKDMYIEYQGTWTHGKHPFDESNKEDMETLRIWKNKNTEYYDGAIDTWTIRDPLKRKTVKENNLNWIEFFSLEEFYDWLNLQ